MRRKKGGKLPNRIEGIGLKAVSSRAHEPSDANAIISISPSGSENKKKKSKRVTSLLTKCFSAPSKFEEDKETLAHQRARVPLVEDLAATSVQHSDDYLEPEPFKSFTSSSTTEEEYYSAISTLDIAEYAQEHIAADTEPQLVQIETLNVQAPAPIPANSVSASEQLVQYIPQVSGVCGTWRKSASESSPTPGPADKVISAGFAVQRVRNKLSRFNFLETKDELKLEIVVPVMGMAPWIETYKKDGSLCKFKFRRDYRSGRAFGQAMLISDGRILLRVWNTGTSPQVMWEEIIEVGEKVLKLDHHAYRLDGTKCGTQRSVLYKCE